MSRVLVVDDEPAVLDALSGILEDLGHEVVQAHDGQEALELARKRAPDLVVTDHLMPHMSGLDLCHQLKLDESLGHVPVILLSAVIEHGTPEAVAFLPKPFELPEFERAVAGALAARRAPASPPAVVPPAADALLGWASRELKSPLSAAKIQVHMLEKSGVGADDARKNPVTGLKRQLAAMELLVGVMAEAGELMGGGLSLRRERTDIPALVSRVVEGWRERAPDYVFQVEVPDEAVSALVDAGRVARALDILVGNAVKHGASAKVVRVELEAAPLKVMIRVSDHGKGIPLEQQADLFRGFRVEAEGAGRGLELYVASEIARSHGGGITVQSPPGKGATFTFTLPKTPQKE